METVKDFIFLDSKTAADGDCSHQIKRCLLLGRKAMSNLDNVLKTKDIALPTKVHIIKAMVFLIVTYGCENWIIMKTEWRRCFRTVVLEKTLKSPLDCKEIKPVNSKGNQPWIFFCSTNAEAEVPILWPLDAKSQLTGKDYWFWEFVFYLGTLIMELLPTWNFSQLPWNFNKTLLIKHFKVLLIILFWGHNFPKIEINCISTGQYLFAFLWTIITCITVSFRRLPRWCNGK